MNADVKRNDIPLKSTIKMPLEMQKRINLFWNSLHFGDIFEKNIFWKMGILGMKSCPIPSNSGWLFFKINDKSMLKVSFKNIDPYQSSKFSKNQNFWKIPQKMPKI